LQQPLPDLNGETPVQAAKTPLGRERLDAMLLMFEGRAGEKPEVYDPDVPALKKSLGLSVDSQ